MASQCNTTYRDDEIVLIFKACNSIPELDKACKILGYLNTAGVQTYNPVIGNLRHIRTEELRNQLRK